MVKLNEDQQRALALMEGVGVARHTVKQEVARYERELEAKVLADLTLALRECVRHKVPKSRMARAYGTKDPYTIPRLIDKHLSDPQPTPVPTATGHTVPNMTTPADPPPPTDSDSDLGVQIVGKSESLVEVTFSQWTPTHDPAPGCNEGCTTTQTYGPHLFEWKWSTVADPARPMIMNRQDREALPTWFMHERGTEWFKDQLAQAWAEVNTNTV